MARIMTFDGWTPATMKPPIMTSSPEPAWPRVEMLRTLELPGTRS